MNCLLVCQGRIYWPLKDEKFAQFHKSPPPPPSALLPWKCHHNNNLNYTTRREEVAMAPPDHQGNKKKFLGNGCVSSLLTPQRRRRTRLSIYCCSLGSVFPAIVSNELGRFSGWTHRSLVLVNRERCPEMATGYPLHHPENGREEDETLGGQSARESSDWYGTPKGAVNISRSFNYLL